MSDDKLDNEGVQEKKYTYDQTAEGKKKRRQSQIEKHVTMLDLKSKDVPLKVIAEAVNMKPEAVKKAIQRFGKVFKNLEHVEDYRDSKQDILDAAQLTVLKTALSESKLKKAGFSSLVTGFKEFNTANRLEKGQSTQNVSAKLGFVGLSED